MFFGRRQRVHLNKTMSLTLALNKAVSSCILVRFKVLDYSNQRLFKNTGLM